MMSVFQPPTFRPHRLIRGGHLQTIASIHVKRPFDLPTRQHVLSLSDGDAIVLHEDQPSTWRRGDSSLLLIHGLCGCHAAGYMLRLADAFFAGGIRVFRLDMRGCGAGSGLAKQLTHAGRSDDVLAALDQVARLTVSGKIGAIGVSLGGNQLLRAVGRVGARADRQPDWFERIDRVAVVSPPVDLQRCSENMQRWVLRPYNYYFIRQLLSRVPPGVQLRSDFQQVISTRRPKTLWELDERITAPLSGFSDAADYYQQCSAMHVTGDNRVKTLVIAAADDPVVPIDCFTVGRAEWPDATEVLISSTGGHVGFIDSQRQSWMDQVLTQWFEGFSR
jgi:predicted alpha/beta-fold hydrolase